MTEAVIDVRLIPPHERHAALFAAFDALAVGSSFVLVNDHDPRPLNYQFNALRTGEFGWDYEEAGPEQWRVRISRTFPAPTERGASCCGTCG